MITKEEFLNQFNKLACVFGEGKNNDKLAQIWYDIFKNKKIEAFKSGIDRFIESYKPMGSIKFPIPAQVLEMITEANKDSNKSAILRDWDKENESLGGNASTKDYNILKKTIADICNMPKDCIEMDENELFRQKLRSVKTQTQLKEEQEELDNISFDDKENEVYF